MRLRTPWIFTLGAGIYEAITEQEIWREHCRQMTAHLGGTRVLDLGIGPGVSGIAMAQAQPGSRYVGMDLSEAMLTRARRKVREAGVTVPLVRADVARLPFPDGAFDAATAHSFFYLLPDSAAALREVHRVVKPGGRVCFFEPGELPLVPRVGSVARGFAKNLRFGTSMALWGIFSGLHGRWTEATLAEALARAGFSELRVAAEMDGLGLLATARRS